MVRCRKRCCSRYGDLMVDRMVERRPSLYPMRKICRLVAEEWHRESTFVSVKVRLESHTRTALTVVTRVSVQSLNGTGFGPLSKYFL